ncbi:MAG: bifunctional DNA primase/polymerase [Pseudomonadota bacterium]
METNSITKSSYDMENKQLDAALYYLNKCNFSVIPAKADKKPFIQWQQFQKEKPPESVVRKWWGEQYKFANIAIITGKVSGLTVLDVDTQTGKALLEEQLPDSFLTPIVDTPGGGEHLYCQYEEGVTNAVRFMDGCDIRSEGGYVIAPPSSDARGGWKWRNGCKITETAIGKIPDRVLTLINSFSFVHSNKINTIYIEGQVAPRDKTLQSVTKRDINFNEGTRDESFFHLVTRLINGHTPIEEIEQILRLINAKCANPPLPDKQLKEKIASAFKRADTRERNLSQEVFEWVRDMSGTFSVTECEQALQLVTREQKANRRQIFHRLIDKGILVKDSIKANTYRAINAEETEIKWWEATGSELKMRFFFDLQEWVKLYPKNIIVLAGSPNAGKTALMLNLAMRSLQENYKVTYLSSEMDATELKVRLELIDKPNFEEMKKIRFLMRNRDFPDVIDPDGVNIIDFFEITDRFYLIAEELKRIWNKLKTGVAFIALQKDPKKTEGRGGTFGLEIPRLYLTVDYDKENSHALRVIKAKNWKGENPNGFIQYFKIHQGVNLYPKGVWKPEI